MGCCGRFDGGSGCLWIDMKFIWKVVNCCGWFSGGSVWLWVFARFF